MNRAKDKWERKQQSIGTFFQLGGETAIEAAAVAGLDYVVIDSEHGPFDVESALGLIRTAEIRGLTPLVRAKEISRPAILKMLDIGAKGLIVPNVESVEQVEKLVKWAKFPPIGERGFFYGRTSGYGFDQVAEDMNSYMATANEESWLIPQCETRGALENIEAIVNLDGVDGIFVGPFDLSISLGMPGAFDRKEFQEALERVLKACKEAKKPAFIFAAHQDAARAHLKQGFDSVTLSIDVNILINAYKNILRTLES